MNKKIGKKEKISYITLRLMALCSNYNNWLFKKIEPFLSNTNVLEIGCGIGNLTQYLNRNREVTAVDINEKYLKYMKLDFPDIELINCDISNPQILAKINTQFKSILCVNILEHIKQDERALANMYKLTEQKGNIIIIVPSHELLFGSIDENVGHCRRYEKKDLINKVNKAGFKIKHFQYFNRVGAFGWFLNSKIRKKQKISTFQIIFFDKFLPVLKIVDNILNFNFGNSMLVVGEK
ncbi:MAG: class I SAM-dependent methyltransferase [Elusimicrobiota bacterium]